MKRFLFAVVLCFSLLLVGVFVFMPSTAAQIFTIKPTNNPSNSKDDLLISLLNLPAPPPPNPLFQSRPNNRSQDFYDKFNPPKDNVTIEELLDYWVNQNSGYRELGYNPKPSDKVLERIFDEIEKDPAKLILFLNVLPEGRDSIDFVKRIYDQQASSKNPDRSWRSTVKQWLTYHSPYFSDELARQVQQVRDTDEYVSNQEELLALTRVDWDKAQPTVMRLYSDSSQRVSQVLARWALYRHALETGSLSDIERYRDELKAVVEDKNAMPGMRDLALDALVKEKEWDGRDDWYYSLLEDETLSDLRVNGRTYTGLTTIIYYGPPEKYLDKMLRLLETGNENVRNAAVRNLSLMINPKNPEIIRALLPWLENPKWAKEVNGERQRVVTALQSIRMPESVPGLIAILNEKEANINSPNPLSNTNVIASNSSTYNTANMAANTYKAPSYYYPFRNSAITALEKQKDPRAVAALRQILPEVDEWERQSVVRALLACNGFSIAEQLEALEIVAQKYNERQDEINAASNAMSSNTMVYNNPSNISTTYYPPTFNAADIKAILGIQLANSTEVSDELVMALIDRINYLDTKIPPLAATLRKFMQNWNGPAVNTLLLRDLKNGKADLDAVVKLLALRKELREKQPNDVYDLRTGNSSALGISACLLEESGDYDGIISGGSDEAKTAMFGCARIIRARLPVQRVAESLKSPNKILALAAERYLESEDSTEARLLVLSYHPNEAKILGATNVFLPGDSAIISSTFLPAVFGSVNGFPFPEQMLYVDGLENPFKESEQKLQKEVKESADLLGVYAYDDNFVRIYKDKAVFSWNDNESRYFERTLSAEEFEGLKNYLASQRVDELVPFLSNCYGECTPKELLMLGRQGGRRVYLQANEPPPFFAQIEKIFEEFRRSPAKLHYYLEKDVPGLEILYTDDNLKARTVWKNGDDVRLLIEDEPRGAQIENELDTLDETEQQSEDYDYEKGEMASRKRREERKYESLAWYGFNNGRLAAAVTQPAPLEYIPLRDGLIVPAGEKRWKAVAGNLEIRADSEGLYKIVGGRQISKLRKGYYYEPLITPNGRWAIVTKYTEDEEDYGSLPVRVNLLTGKEFPVKLNSEYPLIKTVSYIASLNKVLIAAGYGGEYESFEEALLQNGEFFLLDPETGVLQPLKGEFRPLVQQTFRPLQPAGAPNANEFWAALPNDEKRETEVGLYNAKTFTFKPLMKIPQITFNSLEMWVDEKERKIYFVFGGHLLALPLKQ